MGGEWEIEIFNVDNGGWMSDEHSGFNGTPEEALQRLQIIRRAHPECGAFRLIWRP
jgi:hypothetical protein